SAFGSRIADRQEVVIVVDQLERRWQKLPDLRAACLDQPADLRLELRDESRELIGEIGARRALQARGFHRRSFYEKARWKLLSNYDRRDASHPGRSAIESNTTAAVS